MTEYESLLDTLAALKLHDQNEFDNYLETLNTIASLMNELQGGRLKTATYTREFKHARLNVTVQYAKAK